MGPLIIFLLLMGIVIAAVIFFFIFILYTNRKGERTTDDALTNKESELLELYTSLEQMMNEIEAYTQKARREINSDVERVNKLYNELSRNFCDMPSRSNRHMNVIQNKNKDIDYAEKCRLVRVYRDKSHSIPEIARLLDLGQGEVELILKLKK